MPRLRALLLLLVLSVLPTVSVLPAAPASATSSGGNGRIAFIRAGDVYTAAADGRAVRQLTRGGGASRPVWSPDGRLIAYERGGFVWTMREDGTNKIRRLEGRGQSWSPDGRRLAYVGYPAPCSAWGVFVRGLAGGTPRLLDYDVYSCSGGDVGGLGFGGTSWSADGHVLYGTQFQGGEMNPGQSSAVMDADLSVPDPEPEDGISEGVQTLVSFDRGAAPMLDTAPTGDDVVFASNALDDRGRLYVWDRSGAVRRQVGGDAWVSSPVYSPNGRYVLYTQDRPDAPPRVRRLELGAGKAPVTVLWNAEQPNWRPKP